METDVKYVLKYFFEEEYEFEFNKYSRKIINHSHNTMEIYKKTCKSFFGLKYTKNKFIWGINNPKKETLRSKIKQYGIDKSDVKILNNTKDMDDVNKMFNEIYAKI